MKNLWFSLIIVIVFCKFAFAQVSCGMITPKAVNLPKPSYPEKLKGSEKTETVEVKIQINERGDVTVINVSGNNELSKVSEQAAISSKFRPAHPPLKVFGTLKYEFLPNSQVKVTESLDSEEDFMKQAQIECGKILKFYSLRHKADGYIIGLVRRITNKQTAPDFYEPSFVNNGEAKIVIRSEKINSKFLKELKNLKLKVISKIASENSVIGQIPIENIEVLLERKDIVCVYPFWIKPPPTVVP